MNMNPHSLIEEKAKVIDEVLTITEMLKEYQTKIAELPRSVTAARQLAVIISRLQGWHQAFSLSQQGRETGSKEEIVRDLMGMVEDYLDRKL